MTLLSPQQATPAGTLCNMFTAGLGGQDTFPASRQYALEVRNGSGAAITVTLVTPGNDVYGQARPDITKSVPTLGSGLFGPFPPDLADPTTGLVTVTYSATASVTVALIQV